ncbi:MAG: IS1 family transposase [Nitrospira sp.]|nr:IS1 family transposase [Nitrospira sp.]
MNIQPLTIQNLVSNAQCYETVRALRWPEGVRCPHCKSSEVIKRGKDESQPERQRYDCKACMRRFDDLTDTVLAGHHQPLKAWMVCLYFMGLNLSNSQIAQELGLNESDVQQMTEQLREGIEQKKAPSASR